MHVRTSNPAEAEAKRFRRFCQAHPAIFVWPGLIQRAAMYARAAAVVGGEGALEARLVKSAKGLVEHLKANDPQLLSELAQTREKARLKGFIND